MRSQQNLSSLFFGHLARAFPKSTFIGIVSTVRTFLDMFSVKSVNRLILMRKGAFTQPAITSSKLTIKALEQGVKYVQS